MVWDQIEGGWEQLKGKVREHWGLLTDDDVNVIAGSRKQLVDTIQQRYGLNSDDAEREVEEFQRDLGSRQWRSGTDTPQPDRQTEVGSHQDLGMGERRVPGNYRTDAGDLDGSNGPDADYTGSDLHGDPGTDAP